MARELSSFDDVEGGETHRERDRETAKGEEGARARLRQIRGGQRRGVLQAAAGVGGASAARCAHSTQSARRKIYVIEHGTKAMNMLR